MTTIRRCAVTGALVLVAYLLSGCATTLPVVGNADPRLVSALKELPRDGAWERMQCWSGVRLLVEETVRGGANISICKITVNPLVLSLPHETIRAILAHEVGHMMNNDAGLPRINVPRLTKERQADARAVKMLSRISLEACLALPRFLGGLSNGEMESTTHPAPAIRAGETRAACHEQAKERK